MKGCCVDRCNSSLSRNSSLHRRARRCLFGGHAAHSSSTTASRARAMTVHVPMAPAPIPPPLDLRVRQLHKKTIGRMSLFGRTGRPQAQMPELLVGIAD